MSNRSVDFLVQRKDLRACRFADASAPGSLEPGQVLLKVDRFAFTANNVTYAVFGEAMHYWDFFPAPEGWGRVPVWGFAQVAQSTHPEIRQNERVYGYLPMSTHLVMQPDRVSPSHFMDASAHRKPLPTAYQRYSRCTGDPAYQAEYEDQQAILWPLYYTSFLIEDFLADKKAVRGKTGSDCERLKQNRVGRCVPVEEARWLQGDWPDLAAQSSVLRKRWLLRPGAGL